MIEKRQMTTVDMIKQNQEKSFNSSSEDLMSLINSGLKNGHHLDDPEASRIQLETQ